MMLILLAGIVEVAAQGVNFEDGFEDGDFTENPAWKGDTDQFEVILKNDNHLLRLNSVTTETAFLSTPSHSISGTWEFYVEFDGFEPSGSNRAEIFLVSDRANLEEAVNGYAVRVGQSGDDYFKLVRFDDGTAAETLLQDTTVVSDRGGGYRVRVNRDADGVWQMSVGRGYLGELFDAGDSTIDLTYATTSYFGLRVEFTSSRSDRFYFDFKIDLPPFRITDLAADLSEIVVSFNRALDPASLDPNRFTVDQGIGTPAAVERIHESALRLSFTDPLPSGKYDLRVEGITDLNGQPLSGNAVIPFFIFGPAAPADIIINEFRYDPPDGQVEYVELFNRSDQYLDMKQLHAGDRNGLLSLADSTLPMTPHSYVVLTSDTLKLAAEFGPGPYYEWSTFPALNNSGDLIQLSTRSGLMIDSLAYHPSWGGEGVALERRSGEATSLYPENWGDAPGPKGGSPGAGNRIRVDTEAPRLLDMEIADSVTLQLKFNERLQWHSGRRVENFRLNRNRTITAAEWLPPDSVRLTLSPALENAMTYRLFIDGVTDLFSNALSTDTLFTHYRITQADSGEVFINEFSPDPPEGLTEYIELYNPTSESFDLSGWTLSDNTGRSEHLSGQSIILPPRSYLVLAPDRTLEDLTPDIRLIDLGHRFPSLNNSGDRIIIRRADGRLLDSLQYHKAWASDLSSLERRTTKLSAIHKENWARSPLPFGTPGRENAIGADEQPPVLHKITILSSRDLEFLFSEKIDPASAAGPGTVTLEPDQPVKSINLEEDTLKLELGRQLQSGVRYRITIRNLRDIFGNEIHPRSREIRYIRFSQAESGDLVINEFLNLEDDTTGEWVELWNRSEKFIDLSGWIFGDAVATTRIPAGTTMEPKTFLILADGRSSFASTVPVLPLTSFPSLNRRTDAIHLRPPNHPAIDSVYYDRWIGGKTGRSFERKDPLSASGDSANWQVSESAAGHTAGKRNTVHAPDKVPAELLFANLNGTGQIEIRFDEFVRPSGDTRFLADGQEVSVIFFDPFHADRLRLETPSEFPPDRDVIIRVEQLPDYRGNVADSRSIPLAMPVQPGALAINEIMYDPLRDPDDGIPDQSEYIELINLRPYPISLEGIRIHDHPDEKGRVRLIEPVNTISAMITPGEPVVLYADEDPHFSDSDMAEYFSLEQLPPERIFRIDRTSLGLASSDDAVYLADSSGVIVDSVFYESSWHNPNLTDTRGIALERIDPRGPSNHAENWGSSSHKRGGTPAAANSILQEPGRVPVEPGIEFSPNPFSPDGDGFEDRLFINYHLDRPDFLLNVRIYDRYGRLVRKLADGKRAGLEGSLIWDGRTDQGTRNRIGIYIVLFEASDPSTSRRKVYKKTVVIARRF